MAKKKKRKNKIKTRQVMVAKNEWKKERIIRNKNKTKMAAKNKRKKEL